MLGLEGEEGIFEIVFNDGMKEAKMYNAMLLSNTPKN